MSTARDTMHRALAFAQQFEREIIWECLGCGADFPGETKPPYCFNCAACGQSAGDRDLFRRRLGKRRQGVPPEYEPDDDNFPDDNFPL